MRFVDNRQRLLTQVPLAFRKAVYDVQREAMSNAAVSPTVKQIGFRRRDSAPGSLRRSIPQGTRFLGPLRAVVGSALPYARIRDQGGTIRARRGRYLRFQTYDGRWHSVRSVTQRGDRYLTRAGEQFPLFAFARFREIR